MKANWYTLRQIVTKLNQISAVKVNYQLACAPLYEERGRLYTGYHWSELISNVKFTTFHSAWDQLPIFAIWKFSVLLPILGLLRVRLPGRCCVALHYGKVLGASTLLLLASSKIRVKLGQNSSPTENSPMMQFDPSPAQSPRQLQMAHVQNVKILT